MTAPSFFSYSRVFDTEETVYYRRADGCECETEPKGFLKTDASFLEEALFRRTDATTFEGASEKIDFSGRLKMPCN